MNKLQLAAVALLSVFLGACATTQTGKIDAPASVENALPYIKPAVVLACTVVLDQSTSGSDRIEKAKMINHVAVSDESLTLDSVRNSLNDQYDVILITQEEKKVLNGKIDTLYSLDGEQKNGCGFSKSGNYSERLKAINAVLINN
jgi:hypothetical protein